MSLVKRVTVVDPDIDPWDAVAVDWARVNRMKLERDLLLVPPQPTVWAEPLRGRAKVRHTADVFVSQDGLIYITDYDAGLYILQWKGN